LIKKQSEFLSKKVHINLRNRKDTIFMLIVESKQLGCLIFKKNQIKWS